MGWEIGFDRNWGRDIGYGVPAFCDHPDCNKVIDRGLSYVCGSEPYGGDHGCGLYFCEKHRSYLKGGHCVCIRCAKNQKPFNPKPDHPDWINHKETHPSWAKWRKERDQRSAKNKSKKNN